MLNKTFKNATLTIKLAVSTLITSIQILGEASCVTYDFLADENNL